LEVESTDAEHLLQELAEIEALVHRHEKWRRSCINLCAAENALSPRVLGILNSGLVERYGDYVGRDLKARKYYGTRFMVEIEERVNALAKEVFQAPHVELRPLSGHVAGAAVIMATTRPGDTVLEPGSDSGGHRLATKLLATRLADLNVHFLPVDAASYNLDPQAVREQIRATRPRLVIVGSSSFLFPHPVADVARALHAEVPDAVLAYDASHVLGLIAGGQFQDPLAEGADIVFASTHKTFPGPPGGIIFGRRVELLEAISAAVYPGLVTNHHPARMPALGIALLEMRAFGAAFARRIISNSQALGTALDREGITVVGAGHGFTQSHTVLVQVPEAGDAVARRLEAAGLIVNAVKLPWPAGADGLRLGTQECTRLGFGEPEMRQVAGWVAAVIRGEEPSGIGAQVSDLASRHQEVHFAFPVTTKGLHSLD
jgi:glycine hydroxymethyltransferase